MIVIIHNDSTACRFETKSVYTPLRGYYDQQFQYTLIRRSQLRTADSIARTESKYLAFDGMIGVSINAQGEVYSHTLATESTPNGVDCEQVAEFQGMAKPWVMFGLLMTTTLLIRYLCYGNKLVS